MVSPRWNYQEEPKIIHRLKQVGKEELGVKTDTIEFPGAYEKMFQDIHDISHCYIITILKQNIKLDFQAKDAKFFTKIPKNTAYFHASMLKDVNFSRSSINFRRIPINCLF